MIIVILHYRKHTNERQAWLVSQPPGHQGRLCSCPGLHPPDYSCMPYRNQLCLCQQQAGMHAGQIERDLSKAGLGVHAAWHSRSSPELSAVVPSEQANLATYASQHLCAVCEISVKARLIIVFGLAACLARACALPLAGHPQQPYGHACSGTHNYTAVEVLIL